MTAPWSVVGRFTSIEEAAAARSALDVAGIETYLADAEVVRRADSQSAPGPLRVGPTLNLMVHEDDVQRAGVVIRTSALRTREETEVRTCSECGSADLRPVRRLRTLLLLSALFVGAGVAVGQTVFAAIGLIAVVAGVAMMPTHRCGNCGWTSTPLGRASRRAPLPDRPDLVERPCPRCGVLMQRRRCESCGFTLR